VNDYTERYLRGDRVSVWRELIELGSRAFSPDVFPQALQVASEIVDRSVRNLRVLKDRLLAAGYRFADPASVLVEADDRDRAWIATVERELGAMPLVLKIWYERLACVDFGQADDQLFSKSVNEPLAGLGINTVLVVRRLPECLQKSREFAAEAKRDREQTGEPDDRADEPFLPLGDYASNCDAKGFVLPCRAVDGNYYNDGGGPIGFVQDMRGAFDRGGFPAARYLVKRKVSLIPDHARAPIEAFLVGVQRELVPL
jgi:hypothetical protein